MRSGTGDGPAVSKPPVAADATAGRLPLRDVACRASMAKMVPDAYENSVVRGVDPSSTLDMPCAMLPTHWTVALVRPSSALRVTKLLPPVPPPTPGIA